MGSPNQDDIRRARERLQKILAASEDGNPKANRALVAAGETIRRLTEDYNQDGVLLDCSYLRLSYTPETLAKAVDGVVPLIIRAAGDEETPMVFGTPSGRVFADAPFARKSAYMDTDEYRERSRKRLHYGYLINATAVPAADYKGDMVFIDGQDTYSEPSEAPDYYEGTGELVWAFGTETNVGVDLDFQDWVQSWLEDNAHEDAEASNDLDGFDEIADLVEAWVKKQTLTTYFPDYKTIVVYDQAAFDAALAEAKAWVAANPTSFPWESPPQEIDQ